MPVEVAAAGLGNASSEQQLSNRGIEYSGSVVVQVQALSNTLLGTATPHFELAASSYR